MRRASSRRPRISERSHFRDALTLELGMPVARRYSGGQDIHGGCGMLAGRASEDRGPANLGRHPTA